MRERRLGFLTGLFVVGALAYSCSHTAPTPPVIGPDSSNSEARQAEAAMKDERGGPVVTLVCIRDEEERKIELFRKDGGCYLKYIKLGKEKDVASSQTGESHCQQVLAKMKGHLVAAGYQCGT